MNPCLTLWCCPSTWWFMMRCDDFFVQGWNASFLLVTERVTLAWLCSMLKAGSASKMWVTQVRSSQAFACSRSWRFRHTLLNQVYSTSSSLSCTAQSFTVLDPMLVQFLTRRMTESSKLVWTPSTGSSAKITSKCFHPVHHLFSEGEGKQLFEQGPQPDSWTPPPCSQPGCCSRPQQPGPPGSSLDPALAVAEAGCPAPGQYLDRHPPIACMFSCTVYTSLCLAQAFPKSSAANWSRTCLCIH